MAARTTTKKPPAEALAEAPGRPDALTPDVLADLRRPFTVDAIRFKPQVVKDSNAMATFYIDARLAAERLNTVVGPEHWEETYRTLVDGSIMPGHFFPVECTLTVFGISKADVGVYQKNAVDSMAWKSAYSDALKRAAVKFGIGVYLYGLPNVWAEIKIGRNGKAQGFSDAGERKLRGAYTQILKQIEGRFGVPMDHGDLYDPEHDAPVDESPAEPAPVPAPPADLGQGEPGSTPKRDGRIHVTDKQQIVNLVALAREAGLANDVIDKVLANERAETGGHYRKKWLTEQLQELNAAIGAKAAA